MLAIATLCCASLFTGPLVQAAEETLAAQVARAHAAAKSPALGCVVLEAGGEPQVAVQGVRMAGGDDAVTKDDVWHVGSITKSMTATLVARLVEREVVGWDDTVEQHLGELVPDMENDFRDVTLRQLACHRAGLAANIPLMRFGEFGQAPEDPIAERLAFVRIALSQAAVGALETHYEYSNNGFIVIGAMLEAATGEPWETLLKREVFEPLGLSSGGFGAPPDGHPRGHTTVGGKDVPVPPRSDNPHALGPAGRVYMTLADLARYAGAHATQRADFLSAKSWETLHTPPFGGEYALGWIVIDDTLRWHNGSNTMWYAEVLFDRASGKVVAAAVNDGDLPTVVRPVKDLVKGLMLE